MRLEFKVGIRKILLREHRKVLSDHVAEVRAKTRRYRSHDRSRGERTVLEIELIGKAETRRKCFIRILDIAVHSDSTRNRQLWLRPWSKVSKKPPLPLALTVFREVDFPADTVGHGEFGSDRARNPARRKNQRFLGARRHSHARADVTFEIGLTVTEKESGERPSLGRPRWKCRRYRIQVARYGPFGSLGTRRVPRRSECPAPKLDGVVCLENRVQLLTNWKLLFTFREWAIAARQYSGRCQKFENMPPPLDIRVTVVA